MKYGAAMYVEKGRSGEREREESWGKKFGHRRIEGCVRREREEGERREEEEWTIGRAMGT